MVKTKGKIDVPTSFRKRYGWIVKHRPLINSAEKASSFLRDYLDLVVVGAVDYWVVMDEQSGFKMVFHNEKGLIKYAVYELNMLVKLWGNGQ